jgi:hypothetical protein
MANPSLQIGNSNWAIKEDNLLGYSTAGTRFVPQPITMTRASAGTRVNSSGLVETVELLGSEEVTDGNFPTPNTEWSSFGLATINENIVNFVDAGSNTYSGITQDINSFSAKQYKVEITVTNWISGDILATFSSNNASFNITGNGTYSVYLTPVSNGDDIGLVRDYSSGADFSYSITNISVKESTKNNLARVDYDGTASSLLVEPERTNLITYSEDFSQSSWSKSAGGTGVIPIVTSNYGVSPDGTQNADRIQFELNGGTSGGDTSYISDFYTATGVSSTNSIYLKSLSTTKNIRLRCGGTFKNVDVTGDWQRFDITDTSSSDRFQLLLYGNLNSQNADLLVWGGQAEAGSYATSYIPTDGSTVTRVQDQYSKTGISNLINSEEGVLFVEMAALVEVDDNRRFITLNDGGASNNVVLRYESTGVITARYQVGGVAQCSIAFATTITNSHKIAFKYKENDFALWVDGTEIGTDTSGSVLGADTINKISSDSGNGSFPFYGKVKQLQVFKTALTDTELATLTT